MRTLLLLVLLLSISLPVIAQEPGAFMVAIKDDPNPRTNNPGWRIETGEVYKFVRWMSDYEFQGSQLPSKDQSFVVLQVAETVVVSKSGNFAPVTTNAITDAAMKYGREVEQMREAIVAARQRNQPVQVAPMHQQQPNRSQQDAEKLNQRLRDEDIERRLYEQEKKTRGLGR